MEENKVNDQLHMTDQNKFQRLNIYMCFFFFFERILKAVDKNTGDCFCNLGSKEGFSKHNTGERKSKIDSF